MPIPPSTEVPPPDAISRPSGVGEGVPARVSPLAGLLALAFPGAGHMYLGQWRRGTFIAAGVLGLCLCGLLIGGVDVVDREEDPWWFAAQALVGPLVFGIDYVHQNMLKVVDPETGRRRTAHPEIRDATGRVVVPAEVRGPGGRAVTGGPGARPPNSKSLGRVNEMGTLFAAIAGMVNLMAVLDAFAGRRRAS